MNQEIQNYSKKTDQINLGRFLRLLLLQSKLVFLISLIGFVLGLSIYINSDKTYKISSLLQVYSPEQPYDPRQSLSLDLFNATDTNIENLTTLYLSRTNVLNLIKSLNLNITVKDLKDEEILNIKTFLIKKSEENDRNSFYLETQGDFFNLLDYERNFLLKGENGKKFENEYFEILLDFSNLNPGEPIEINYFNPSNLYNTYKQKLKVNNLAKTSNYWNQEGLIEVFVLSEDVNEGKLILNTANEIFIKDNIKVETEKARTSILFIDSQLESLEKILNLRKNEIQSFKQTNKSLNVNLEVESIIQLIADVEKEINKVDLELSQAEINFTKDNPLYINLKIQKEALELQKINIEQKIENLPIAQQEYIDLFRNLEVTEELFSELVNRKLNFSIEEASSIGNIRVVDQAYIDRLVSPRLVTIFILTIISFFIGILIATFRGAFFLSISNPAELKDAGIEEKIVGVIPHIDDMNLIDKDNKFDQAIETSVLNIETIINSIEASKSILNCKKILMTSPTANNGKSFISKSIAEGLARIGHKVLILDADLKKGSQHKLFLKETIELKTFKDISLDNIENLRINDNLYLLPKLKKLKNSFEYLYSDTFIKKISEFEGFFDYIIIDTAPALSVSDTGLLMTSSDLNFLIVRHQVSRINEVTQSMQIIDQIGRSFDGVFYNDYQKPKGYYGYYDLYGDYSYRYYAERYLYDDYYDERDD